MSKLSNEQCKKLYEISRNSDDPEWSKLYPQQRTALRTHYRKALRMMKEKPHLYKRSKVEAAEDIIDKILREV